MSNQQQKSNTAGSSSNSGGSSNKPQQTGRLFITPQYLIPTNFADARRNEINEFINAVTVKKSNARAFQSLPRYLRRRTMSHNVYRLPIHLRRRAQREMEKSASNQGKDTVSKKKTIVRKAKRRPYYLLRDYARRQKKFKWLETHIWHAKRMHMTDLWGFKIAKSTTGKGVRSTFRASSHLCTLYDSSYYQCIQISGSESDIISLFARITMPSISISGKCFINGEREGTVDIYYPDRYPFHFIAPVRFLWDQQPQQPKSTMKRNIWVWIHPAALNETHYILQNTSLEFNDLKVESLDDQLLRFELTGSKTHQILSSIIFPINPEPSNTTSGGKKLNFYQVWNTLRQLRTPATLPTGTVISMDIYDPRLLCTLPDAIALQVKSSKNSKATPPTFVENVNQSINQMIVNWSQTCSQVAESKLWSSTHRKLMTKVEPNCVINDRRNRASIIQKAEGYELPSIMLIQRDGGLTRGYGSGWDLIIPKGWGMPFWMSLIYTGAWPIGLEERDRFLLEQGIPSFPRDYPDSNSNLIYFKNIKEEETKEYEKRPKGKRPNYLNNGIFSPFSPDWEWILQIKDSSNDENNNKEEQLLQFYLENIQIFIVHTFSTKPVQTDDNNNNNEERTVFNPNPRGLVRVSVKMFNRGKPVPNSVIYAPNDRDIELLKNKYYRRDYNCVSLEVTSKKFPTDKDTFYDVSTRKPIGYVVNGEQSLVRGNGAGLGFCSAIEFVNLHNNSFEKNYSPSGFGFIQNPSSKMLYPVILTIRF
eukprot:gene2765-3439_t